MSGLEHDWPVHAPDDVGLLARVAAVFVDLELDVGQALVATIGDRVVDVFYLHDTTGTRFTQRHAIESWEKDGDFKAAVGADPKIAAYLTREKLNQVFSLGRHLEHVDRIFERVFVSDFTEL